MSDYPTRRPKQDQVGVFLQLSKSGAQAKHGGPYFTRRGRRANAEEECRGKPQSGTPSTTVQQETFDQGCTRAMDDGTHSQLPTPLLHVCEVPKKQGREADTTLSRTALTSDERRAMARFRDLVGYFRDCRSTMPDNRRCCTPRHWPEGRTSRRRTCFLYCVCVILYARARRAANLAVMDRGVDATFGID
jgi:hypothetical protein